MDPHNDIMPHSPAPESEAFNWRNLFKPENLSLALASFAAILALAPYVVPQVQTYMIRQGLVHHPELLKETIDALQAKQMADQQKTFQAALKTNQHLLISPDDPNYPGRVSGLLLRLLPGHRARSRSGSQRVSEYPSCGQRISGDRTQFPNGGGLSFGSTKNRPLCRITSHAL